MASSSMSTRFALLVGVDFYWGHKRVHRETGQPISLRPLAGAVNDVTEIKRLLRNRFDFHSIRTLASSSPSPGRPKVPKEPENDWPTHANIKKEFDSIRNEARPGDIFFFHFSGHGAPLETVPSSPNDGREHDLSLMTADYCDGKPAVRGWELNEWLRGFYEKGIRVVALLDSCHSGGSWRGEDDDNNLFRPSEDVDDGYRFRSPEDWVPPVSLPADEEAVQGTQRKPGYRDGDLASCWDINPKEFTLMVACQSTEKAAETTDRKGVTYGAFTLALIRYFDNELVPQAATYHIIRNHVAQLMAPWTKQKPHVYGHDRLAFLEAYEPISATPIPGMRQQDYITLYVGKIHGIEIGTEYVLVSETSRKSYRVNDSVIVRVYEVSAYQSKAVVELKGNTHDIAQHIQVVPFKWSSKSTFRIDVHQSLSQRFRDELRIQLRDRIAGNIEIPDAIDYQQTASRDQRRRLYPKKLVRRLRNLVTGESRPTHKKGESTKDRDSGTSWFELGVNEGRAIEIFGPEQVLGDRGPVRGWTTRGETDAEKARESAIALAHLYRFGQILQLGKQPNDAVPFQVTVANKEGSETTLDFEFQNLGRDSKGIIFDKLYFALLILSPGFHVKQIYPELDGLEEVKVGFPRSFEFDVWVPETLERTRAVDSRGGYRDVIRVVVCNQQLSLAAMEIPAIWHAEKWENKSFRNGGLVRENVKWWIHDEIHYIK